MDEYEYDQMIDNVNKENQPELVGEVLNIRFPEQDELDEYDHKWAKIHPVQMKERYESGDYAGAIVAAESFLRTMKDLEKSKKLEESK